MKIKALYTLLLLFAQLSCAAYAASLEAQNNLWNCIAANSKDSPQKDGRSLTPDEALARCKQENQNFNFSSFIRNSTYNRTVKGTLYTRTFLEDFFWNAAPIENLQFIFQHADPASVLYLLTPQDTQNFTPIEWAQKFILENYNHKYNSDFLSAFLKYFNQKDPSVTLLLTFLIQSSSYSTSQTNIDAAFTIKDSAGNTPLHIAIERYNLHLVKKIINHPALSPQICIQLLKEKNNQGNTVLNLITICKPQTQNEQNNFKEISEIIDTTYGNQLLGSLASGNVTDAKELLTTSNASLDRYIVRYDNNQNTVLHNLLKTQSQDNHKDAIRFIFASISPKTKVQLLLHKNNEGNTPLHEALLHNTYDNQQEWFTDLDAQTLTTLKTVTNTAGQTLLALNNQTFNAHFNAAEQKVLTPTPSSPASNPTTPKPLSTPTVTNTTPTPVTTPPPSNSNNSSIDAGGICLGIAGLTLGGILVKTAIESKKNVDKENENGNEQKTYFKTLLENLKKQKTPLLAATALFACALGYKTLLQ